MWSHLNVCSNITKLSEHYFLLQIHFFHFINKVYLHYSSKIQGRTFCTPNKHKTHSKNKHRDDWNMRPRIKTFQQLLSSVLSAFAMTSSNSDLKKITTELNHLSLKRQQLLERKKILCVFQELLSRDEFGQTGDMGKSVKEIYNLKRISYLALDNKDT